MIHSRGQTLPVHMKLQTPRLILREMNLDDLDFLAGMLADPQVMKYWPAPLTREQSVEWIQRQQDRYARHGCGYWLAVERETNEPVGQAGVIVHELDDGEQPGLGYIIHRPFWRRGFGFEAASACVDFIFNELNRERAIALVRPENEPSQRLALKLGMTPGQTIVYAHLEHIIFSKPRRST